MFIGVTFSFEVLQLLREIFTRNYNLLFISNIALCTAFYMIIAVFPPYALNDLQISQDKVGVVVGAFSLSALAVRPFVGKAIDKYNRLYVYLPSLALFVVCCLLYSIANNMTEVLFVRLLHGVAWSGITAGFMTIVADIVPVHLRGRGIGYAGLSMTFAMAFGPAIGLYVIDYTTYSQFFIVCMALSIIGLMLAFLLRLPKVERVQLPANAAENKGMFEKNVFGISFAYLMTGFAYASIVTFMVLHADNLGITQKGLFFLIFGLFVGICRPLSGRIMDTRSPTSLVVVGILSNVVCLVMLGLTDSVVLFLLSGVFGGIGVGILFPTYTTMGMNIVPASRRGAANSTIFSAMDIGIAFGSMALGVVAKNYGYPAIYFLSAFLMLLPLVWYFTMGRQKYVELVKIYKK